LAILEATVFFRYNPINDQLRREGPLQEKKKAYVYTLGEEIANATTHGPMAALVLFLLPYAAIRAYIKGGALDAFGVSIFVISVFLMFLASTLYHVMAGNSRHKAVFKILDHIFIYVAIAGSYTPIALSIIGGWQGLVITVIQWLMVLFGVLYKSLSRRSIPKVSLTIYLVMGWTIIFFLPVFLAKADKMLLSFITLGVFSIPQVPTTMPRRASGTITWSGTCL
jgi:hemolysin III